VVMSGLRVGVLGATGVVGERVVSILEEREFPVAQLELWAGPRSVGRRVSFRGEALKVEAPSEQALSRVDVAFFAAGNEASARWAPVAREGGALVVDKGSLFRMDPQVPLVVPEVNPEALPAEPRGALVASPNCSTIPLVMVLKALSSLAPVRRVVVATYQAVSGTGRDGLLALDAEEAAQAAGREPPPPQVYPSPIHENVLAHCDAFGPDGFTKEETKLREESRKILSWPHLGVLATAVRVPVRVGHGEAVSVEFTAPVEVEAARQALRTFPGLELWDDPPQGRVPTPQDVDGRDPVLVGRVRSDPTLDGRGLALWLVSDNLRKGAALNAVQIAERLLGVGPR
jgi:aspartate-semialdehyde dehydrogenase